MKVFLILVLALFCVPAHSMFDDDPLLNKTMAEVELFEDGGERVIEWDIDFWLGRDLNKFWLKSSGEVFASEVEEANIELVYSRAATANWDQQFGVRQDIRPNEPDARSWVSYGYIGTAPWFIDVDARLFIGEESSSQLLIELEKEIMLSQRWVLTPELDIIANGNTSAAYQEGSGLSEVEFALRLGYEKNRKFQPFVALIAKRSFGTTKNFREASGESGSDLELAAGLHFWF